MKLPGRLTLALLIISSSALAGCFGADEDTGQFTATLSNAQAADGWDYAGDTLRSASGSLTVDVNHKNDTGVVEGTITIDGVQYGIRLDTFSGDPAKAFQDGGVAADFEEHGDSGFGDSLIPKVNLLLATWGPATLTRDGEAFPDPFTGAAQWSAHLMVTDTAIRGSDGVIAKADGSTPYDPDAPGDARRLEDTLQGILVLRSPAGDPVATAFEDTWADTATTHQYAREYTFHTVEGAEYALNGTLTGSAGAPPVGELTFTLMDPDGEALATETMSGPNGNMAFTVEGVAAKTGDYTLQVTGNGAQANYEVAVATTPPGAQLITLWFDGVQME